MTNYIVAKDLGGKWAVWRANKGGDVFHIESFETEQAADWKRAELEKLEAEGRAG